jgi:hypothetical protein
MSDTSSTEPVSPEMPPLFDPAYRAPPVNPKSQYNGKPVEWQGKHWPTRQSFIDDLAAGPAGRELRLSPSQIGSALARWQWRIDAALDELRKYPPGKVPPNQPLRYRGETFPSKVSLQRQLLSEYEIDHSIAYRIVTGLTGEVAERIEAYCQHFGYARRDVGQPRIPQPEPGTQHSDNAIRLNNLWMRAHREDNKLLAKAIEIALFCEADPTIKPTGLASLLVGPERRWAGYDRVWYDRTQVFFEKGTGDQPPAEWQASVEANHAVIVEGRPPEPPAVAVKPLPVEAGWTVNAAGIAVPKKGIEVRPMPEGLGVASNGADIPAETVLADIGEKIGVIRGAMDAKNAELLALREQLDAARHAQPGDPAFARKFAAVEHQVESLVLSVAEIKHQVEAEARARADTSEIVNLINVKLTQLAHDIRAEPLPRPTRSKPQP